MEYLSLTAAIFITTTLIVLIVMLHKMKQDGTFDRMDRESKENRYKLSSTQSAHLTMFLFTALTVVVWVWFANSI